MRLRRKGTKQARCTPFRTMESAQANRRALIMRGQCGPCKGSFSMQSFKSACNASWMILWPARSIATPGLPPPQEPSGVAAGTRSNCQWPLHPQLQYTACCTADHTRCWYIFSSSTVTPMQWATNVMYGMDAKHDPPGAPAASPPQP